MTIGKQEIVQKQEAYELVCKLNDEMAARFGDSGETSSFYFTTNGWACAIQIEDLTLWDNQNCSMYDEDDNEISIEFYVRRQMNILATTAEWIARDHAREKIALDHCLFFLNGLVKVDADAVKALVEMRVPCNVELSNHPTVQVQLKLGDNQTAKDIPEDKRECLVGFLGVINGMFGAFRDGGPKDGWGQIMAVFEEDGSLSSFKRTPNPRIKPVASATGRLGSSEPKLQNIPMPKTELGTQIKEALRKEFLK